MIDELIEIHTSSTSNIPACFKRYLYDEINWESRMIGIIGARGVGKTTLILQYYKEYFNNHEDCLYLSCDNIRVLSLGIFNIAQEYFKLGGRVLLLDEIHKYPNWSLELKNIHDAFPLKKLVFSGSSSLNIIKGQYDISRRSTMYTLNGLSFREYLNIEKGLELKPYSLENIIKENNKISLSISKKLPVLKYFKKYLEHGYYPFYLEEPTTYSQKLLQVLEKIIYEDIPSVFNLKQTSMPILKKMIFLIASSQPFVPNIKSISSSLGISREYVYLYIDYLYKAGIFSLLFSKGTGLKLIRKPAKIYLNNTNLFYALEKKEKTSIQIGSVRECFFLNQLENKYKIFYPEIGDFIVDNKYLFEIGGKTKDFMQIKNIKDSYIASDNIEVGFKHKIPLYLFGLLY